MNNFFHTEKIFAPNMAPPIDDTAFFPRDLVFLSALENTFLTARLGSPVVKKIPTAIDDDAGAGLEAHRLQRH